MLLEILNSVWGTCQCLAAFLLTNCLFLINLFIELLPLNEYKSAKDYAIQTGYNRCLSLSLSLSVCVCVCVCVCRKTALLNHYMINMIQNANPII